MRLGEPLEFSVVIPCMNEAENVTAIAAAVSEKMQAESASYEIIFIDNASTDSTADIVKGLCREDARIRLIVNTRNFGQMRSPVHAIYQTSGAAVIGISADFQDPPGLIPEFIRRWRNGAMIVLAVRASEKTSWLLRTVRAIGYGFFEKFGDYRVIPNATGFGLYDRRVVDTLRNWNEPEPFFRGMLAESGFPVEIIPYHRPPRAGGVSKNDLFSFVDFAVSGLASSSKQLLRFPLYVSLLVFMGAAISLLVAVGLMLWGRGWETALVVTVMLGLAGVILFFLGLIGTQVRAISDVVRGTPLVVERERVNLDSCAD